VLSLGFSSYACLLVFAKNVHEDAKRVSPVGVCFQSNVEKMERCTSFLCQNEEKYYIIDCVMYFPFIFFMFKIVWILNKYFLNIIIIYKYKKN